MIQTAVTTIPNTLIETMFYRSVTDYRDVQTYRSLLAKGTSQGVASATAFASRKVEKRLEDLLEKEQEMKATVERYEGPSIYDHPEMLK